MSRTPIVAANWKMNDPPAGWDTAHAPYAKRKNADIIVLPSMIDIPACINAGLNVGAQCGRAEASGAFTGDVSMEMLKRLGCTYVLCGHSERRQHHHESDEMVAAQAAAAMSAGLIPIICMGETMDQREMKQEKEVVKQQLTTASHQLQATSFVIAYEPVWAIGTGKTATPDDAQEMHAFIRSPPAGAVAGHASRAGRLPRGAMRSRAGTTAAGGGSRSGPVPGVM